MLSGERMVVREAARYWWLFLVSGILWLLIAWMVLRLDATSIATVGVLLGVVFGLSGINEVGLAGVAPGGWKLWHYDLSGLHRSPHRPGGRRRARRHQPRLTMGKSGARYWLAAGARTGLAALTTGLEVGAAGGR